MSDVTTSAAVGVVTFPLLASMGIDPPSMVAGLLGCVIVQSLMPAENEKKSIGATAWLTLGSVLFASVVAPVFTPWVLSKLPDAGIPKVPAQALCAVLAGALAQPIVIALKKGILPAAVKKVKSLFNIKEEPNA